MRLRELTAADLGERVALKARHIDVTGILEAYGHQHSKFVESYQLGAVRSTIETSVTIAGHEFGFSELIDADIEVLP